MAAVGSLSVAVVASQHVVWEANRSMGALGAVPATPLLDGFVLPVSVRRRKSTASMWPFFRFVRILFLDSSSGVSLFNHMRQ